jgi:hypothetical protein
MGIWTNYPDMDMISWAYYSRTTFTRRASISFFSKILEILMEVLENIPLIISGIKVQCSVIMFVTLQLNTSFKPTLNLLLFSLTVFLFSFSSFFFLAVLRGFGGFFAS